jgi:hypothetical protein
MWPAMRHRRALDVFLRPPAHHVHRVNHATCRDNVHPLAEDECWPTFAQEVETKQQAVSAALLADASLADVSPMKRYWSAVTFRFCQGMKMGPRRRLGCQARPAQVESQASSRTRFRRYCRPPPLSGSWLSVASCSVVALLPSRDCHSSLAFPPAYAVAAP